MSSDDISRLIGSDFSLNRSFGIMLLPVHKLPDRMRSSLLKRDFAMANGRMKEYSSYLVFELVKKENSTAF